MHLPIEYLSLRVVEIINKLTTLDIRTEIDKGLNPTIYYIDNIKDIGGINSTNILSNEATIYISKPYCQMLWIICNIALRIHDSAAVVGAYEKMNVSEKNAYNRELEIDCHITRYLKQVGNWENTLKVISELGEIIKRMLNCNISNEEIACNEYISDLKSELATRVNSLYCYGTAFILAHEFSHFSLGHNLSIDSSIEEEKDADSNAFWAMFCDLEGAEKETAMMGVICALSSLLFINPILEKDCVHPQENERLFNFYDIVFDEIQKKSYMQMLIMLLTTWAVCCEIDDFPKVVELNASSECLNEMRQYLARLAAQAPVQQSIHIKNSN